MLDHREVDQMAKFMAAMNGISESAAPAAGKSLTTKAGGDPGVAEMRTILERFHAATDNVVADASFDFPLREALLTEPTAHGAKIGNWEIRVHEQGRRKLYDVVSSSDKKPLAVDLWLYEAAHGLVRILNNGGRINSPNAIALLRAEQEYNSMVQDMVLFKQRLIKNPNSPRFAVYEARYSDAKGRAIQARDHVCQLAHY